MQELPFENVRDINNMTAFMFESICRRYTQYAYLGNDAAICRILSRYKLYIDVKDTSVAPHLITDGFWETWLTRCMAEIIKPGDICIDAGANVGYYSILMSALSGNSGRTLAVEPNPRMCQLLRSTSNIHNTYFDVAEVALSDKEGRITLHVPEGKYGGASLLKGTGRFWLKSSKAKVKMVTLDELAKRMNLPRVDVIKIDVEGHEPQVLKGMQGIIKANPDLKIILEYSPFLYEDPIGFTQYLFEEFTVHRIKDVDALTTLDFESVNELVALTDHTDLYLQRKQNVSTPPA